MSTKLIAGAVGALLLLAAMPARAQGFLVPYVGKNVGEETACPEGLVCTEEVAPLHLGLALGSHGGVGGFEADFDYVRNFFGEGEEGGSSLVIFMANVILGAPSGPVRPYVVGGVGLIKSHVNFDVDSLVSTDGNNAGWDIGGGLVAGTSRIGLRGDIRRFKTFGELPLGFLPVGDDQLKFWRASVGLFLGF